MQSTRTAVFDISFNLQLVTTSPISDDHHVSLCNSLLTLSPLNKLLFAEFLVCFNFQSASMTFKVGKNVVHVSNSLDLGETSIYSASHPDPSCLHMEL